MLCSLRPMFVNGNPVEVSTGRTFEVTNPATGEVIGNVADGAAADATLAIDAAAAALPEWSATTASVSYTHLTLPTKRIV